MQRLSKEEEKEDKILQEGNKSKGSHFDYLSRVLAMANCWQQKTACHQHP